MASDRIQNKSFRNILWVFLVAYVVYGAYLVFSQERIIYQPTPQDFATCVELAQAEKVTYEGTRMYFKNNGPRVVVLYHGNYGSACDRAFFAELFEEGGYSYLLPEYAGYSNDTVSPSHERIKKDVEHVTRFLTAKNFSDVVVVGESVGVRFASYHTSLSRPQKILLIASFVSLTDVARNAFWYYPVALLMNDPFDNARLIGDFPGDVVLLHGGKDNIVPLKSGEKLFEHLAAPNKKLMVVPEAGHNDLFLFPESWQAIRDFLK
ncbi:MAG: alpha/beta hydrolase [Minisyncoccota bacterium]